jgi:hypothetical protein
MNGIFEVIAKVSILAAMVILVAAGTLAIRRSGGWPGILLLVGASISLLCYILITLGFPAVPGPLEEQRTGFYVYIAEAKYTLLPIGHLISALGVLGLVRNRS